jgi:hypothetical protein
MGSLVIPGAYKIDIAVEAFPQKVASYGLPVLNSLVGVDYRAIAYLGSQLVNGTNHAILVLAKPVTQDPVTTLKVVILHEKMIDEIKYEFTIGSIGESILTYGPGIPGGLTAPESFADTAEEAAALWAKCEPMVGASYVPKCVLATGVVNGIKTIVLAEATLSTLPTVQKAVVMYLLTKPDGEVTLSDIQDLEF